MFTFTEANQARLALKMKLHKYGWYSSSFVLLTNGGYIIYVFVKQINNNVKKVVAPTFNGFEIRLEEEK